MSRFQTPLRLAACSAIAALGIASASTFAQMGDPAADAPQPGMNDRGPGGNRGPGMRGGGGPAAAALTQAFGATVRPLPRDQAQANDVKPGVGLVVETVKEDSIAAKGGLKSGDVIFKLGDQWVINPAQLATLLSIQDVDNSIELKVKRGSERVDLDYKFDQAAHDAMMKAMDAAPGGPGGGRRGGGGNPGGPGGERPTPPAGGGMNP